MTEDDLRLALRERSDLWENRLEQLPLGDIAKGAALREAPRGRIRPRGFRPYAVGAVVAATFVAVTVATAVIHDVDRPAEPAVPATQSGPAAAYRQSTSTAATRSASPINSTRPAVAPPKTVTSPETSKTLIGAADPDPVSSPGRVTGVDITNRITVGGHQALYWDFRDDVEYVTVELGGVAHAEIAAYASSAGFGAGRVSDPQSITIDGHAGWFGGVSDWPANGRPDPVTGKQNGEQPSVVWQLADGTWLSVSADTNPGRQQLIALAESFQIRPAVHPIPVPFTVGWLPENLRVTALIASEPRDNAQFANGDFSVELTDAQGNKTTIELQPTVPPSDNPDDISGAQATSSGGYTVIVTATGLSVAQRAAISKSIEVVSDPDHPSNSWPLLAAAFPSTP